MIHITDQAIEAAMSPHAAQQALAAAFRDFANGRAAMQERMRTEAAGVKISTMSAVLPAQGYAGSKVYTTLQGRFTFVILLFSAHDGRPLATLDADALTRLRTAACTVIASSHLARRGSRVLALYGAGVQGRAHARQLAQAFALDEIRVVDPYAPESAAGEIENACGTRTRMCTSPQALEGADIVVTASRSTQALFRGEDIPRGAFVAAIGSSLPHTRELDDAALARADRIVVEWKPQALREAGDLAQAPAGILDSAKLVELGDLVAGRVPGRGSPDEIILYKSVGVALEDVALAGLAYELVTGERAR